MKTIQDLEVYAKENHVPIMMKEGIEFLLDTIQQRPIQDILEIGTAIGYSAIRMAKLKKEIQIDTLEIDENSYCIAIKNIQENQCTEQIHPYLLDAMMFVPQRKYDLIFVDAAKSQYRRYMEHFLPYLKDDGIFFFDNLNFHGIVDDLSLTKNRQTRQLCTKIKRFRDWIQECEGLDTQFYGEIGDGIAVVSIKNKKNMLE